MRRRWNGWGDEEVTYEVTDEARKFIEERVGPAQPPRDVSLSETLAKMPESRLPDQAMLDKGEEVRARHAVGQSFPDWLAIRSGTVAAYPDAVAFPESRDDVAELLRLAGEWGAVVIPYGGGTSVAGHLNADRGERPVLSLSLERMTDLLDLDGPGRLATFGAGVPGPTLEAQLAEHGFTLGHYPQSFELSTLGGWVATRSSGHFSLGYGRIEDLFVGGHVETPVGPLDLPAIPASAAGPDLRHFILGSEGRMGVITECTVRISARPEEGGEVFRGAFFPNPEQGRAAVREIVQSDLSPTMLRLSLPTETETSLALGGPSFVMKLLNAWLAINRVHDGKCLLLYGASGSRRGTRLTLAGIEEVIKTQGGVVVGPKAGEKWYGTRFHYPYIRNTLWESGYAADTLETAVPWVVAPQAVDAIEAALHRAADRLGERVHVFTHHSHVYPHGASIYTSYVFRCSTKPGRDGAEETLEHWSALKAAASQAVVEQGGTISHQHGVGHDHAPYLEAEKGALGLDMLRNTIHHLDPEGVLGSGNLVDDGAR